MVNLSNHFLMTGAQLCIYLLEIYLPIVTMKQTPIITDNKKYSSYGKNYNISL